MTDGSPAQGFVRLRVHYDDGRVRTVDDHRAPGDFLRDVLAAYRYVEIRRLAREQRAAKRGLYESIFWGVFALYFLISVMGHFA